MMKRFRPVQDSSGSAAIEFAIAAPVLISMIWGLFQVGILFEANAGVQQALGEGARFATTFDTTTGTSPTTTQVQAKITSGKFGLVSSGWDTPTIDTTHAAAASGGYWDITVNYHVTPDWLFFQGSAVTITKSKRVYLSV